ncbi:MAG: glycosyltransferase family 4 protein [Nitrosopumilaceae archaeon]
MKLCVFPNDSILSYYQKGEIKERYFNPLNLFDEVHVISLFDDEVDEKLVQKLAGKGVLKIHKLKKANLSNYKIFRQEVISLVSSLNPLLIRAFNSRVPGWLATNTALKLGIPLVISLHTNYDQQRDLAKRERNFFRYFKLLYSKKLEKYCLKNADAVICVYEFIVPYAKKMKSKNIQVIYNKVDTKKFSNNVRKKFFATKPTIISVGRLIEQKNHRYLIEAMKNLDAKLLIIGDGPNLESLNKIIQTLNLENKVEIIKKVSNDELPNYYVSCDLYVQPMENLGGIPIPVLEAMACGLPVVMSKHSNNDSEIIDDAVVFVENNSDSFFNAFNKILSNPEYKEKLKRKSLNVITKISGEKMEEEELSLYRKLIDKTKKIT